MFRAVYTVLLVAGLFLMAPVLVFRAVRLRKYIGSLSERLGAPDIRPSKKPTLWIHAVSVGEVVAVERFVREAVTAFPNWRVAVSRYVTQEIAERLRHKNIDAIIGLDAR